MRSQRRLKIRTGPGNVGSVAAMVRWKKRADLMGMLPFLPNTTPSCLQKDRPGVVIS